MKQMDLRKNDIITAVISDYSNEGSGVARYMGWVIFVPGTAVGDEARIRIVKVHSSYCYGRLEELIVPSADRIAPSCAVCTSCGGCDFAHISYEAEKRAKTKFVRDAFERVASLPVEVRDVMSLDVTEGYRNKAQYPVHRGPGGKAVFGFYSRGSHRLIPWDDCRIQPSLFNRISREACSLADALGIPAYDEEDGSGILRHIYLRSGAVSGEVMVCLVVTDDSLSSLRKLAEGLREAFPRITTILLNRNDRNTNVVLGKENTPLYGDGVIRDVLCGIELEISPQAFYQVNHDGAEKLYSIAREAIGLKGTETLLDLYCGAGTIGLSMADRVRSLIGVEIVPEAVENAERNARKLGLANATFICSDAGKAARELAGKGLSPDVIVVDPPRKGCDAPTLDAMVRMKPDKICMISCNPVTAARDCRYLADRGYSVRMVQPFDMFPRTRHIESLMVLERKN